MFWIELIPATIFLIALFFIPESPRFLVTKGRTEAARSVLDRLVRHRRRADARLARSKDLSPMITRRACRT